MLCGPMRNHFLVLEGLCQIRTKCSAEVPPLIEDDIEDGHDANHGVERSQSSHRGESSFVVDNHEDEEDKNS